MARRPPAAARQGRSQRLAHRAHGAGLERRGTLPPRAERHASVRRPQPRRHRHRRDHRDGRRHRVRRGDSRRPDGDRPARTRTPAVCAARSGRAHADPALHRRRRSRSRSSTPRSCAIRPSDFEVQVPRRVARPAGRRRRPICGAPPRSSTSTSQPHAPDRSHRSEPRSLVARPFVGRPDRRGAHAPVRQPHLRALGQRGRGHHGLRSPAAAQHLHLRLGREARGARPLLQRRRPRRLRRPRLRGRYRRSRRTATGSTAPRTCASGSAPAR